MVRVLVVEDDPDDAILTGAYLKESTRLEFDTVFAATPQQALAMMSREQHDICLLDYMLGATDGFTVFAEARAHGYTRPVILLTGQGSADVATVALEAGFSDFLEKSRVDGALLERAIQYTLERKRAEQEIITLNQDLDRRIRERTEELMAANRELEGFTYTVSHDLRGPLRAILSTSHILLEDHGTQLDDEGQQLLKRQVAGATKLSTLIDELLRLARLSRQEMVWSQVDISALATEVAHEVLSRGWPQTFNMEIQEGLIAKGDRGLLISVFQNLLENACKFSPDGGNISFGARPGVGELIYFVKDEGIGFDMSYADKVFRPFERLVRESEFPGTGIGLANVERVVHRHNGRIWVESEPVKGTTFFFTLNA